jgi:HlyD family secretion protein
LRLDSRELQKDLKRLQAENRKALAKVAQLTSQVNKSAILPTDRVQLQAQLSEAEIEAEGTKQQIDVIMEQLAMMDIHAPQDGIVTTWEVRQNLLGRPVDVGQELVQLAATDGEWVLEVEVPDDDMGPVLDAQSKLNREIAEGKKPPGSALAAYFVTATDPEHRYPGFVRRIAAKAETVEAKHVVKVTVGFTDKVRDDYLKRNRELRPGAEVRARIECGQARLAYCLLRDVVHVWYETVLFRWPFLQ